MGGVYTHAHAQADCVRCEDCLAFFDAGEYCAECGDDFCGCARDALECDECKEPLCSKCASIFACVNCHKGYCLMKAGQDVTGCAIKSDALWMCPDCWCVGYCKSAPQPHATAASGQSPIHNSCMEYGSVECEDCKLRVCLSCAKSSASSPTGAGTCARCGAQRSARLKQVLKLRLKRLEDGCQCKQCKLKKGFKSNVKSKRVTAPPAPDWQSILGGGRGAFDGGGRAGGKSSDKAESQRSSEAELKAAAEAADRLRRQTEADFKAKKAAADRAFNDLMQMEAKDKAGEAIEDPPYNIRIICKDGTRRKGGAGGGGWGGGRGVSREHHGRVVWS